MGTASALWVPEEPGLEWPITPAWSRTAKLQLEVEAGRFSNAARILGFRPQTGVDPDMLGQYLINSLRIDGPTGKITARDIAQHLSLERSFNWWGTPLGRACAWHIGYLDETPPSEVVTAVLGFSRQYHSRIRARRVANGLPRDLSDVDLANDLRARWNGQRDTWRAHYADS